MSEQATRDILQFLTDLRDPEQLGHAVSDEVRRRARELTNMLLRQPPDREA